jgi:predicted site-specific integrase-resolvase
MLYEIDIGLFALTEELGMIKRRRRAAIYSRVSTDKQTTDNQERELREIAERSGLGSR